jgi:thiamine biosynthesis lipoprotein
MAEATTHFRCFGSDCAAFVIGSGRLGPPGLAVQLVRRQLLHWHERFSRFEPGSELSRLNGEPRARVGVSRTMASLAEAVVHTAEDTGGLVDATLVDEIEGAGYTSDLEGALPLADALGLAPERTPAGPSPRVRWREIAVDLRRRIVTRPPGVRLDSGGIAKGLFADLIADALADHPSFAVDCGGDLRVGGAAGIMRAVDVASPFDSSVLHRFELAGAGVATSGIGKRSWLDSSGAPAHHLLDPATGRPAFTGIVQATAIAPTALTAEILAKAAVLSGPDLGRGWLRYGGVLVYEDGGHERVDARRSPVSASAQHLPRVA